ncbi:TonB-dependent receptor [Lunatibacter salilacus]|uniref:TonB-dependent receptor n=1 Tax=Lunatibacter salilacus TaxID=2483804 RepID=UPI00131C12AD|nr:TonB-dependent receptor [Lunatibacter salilacus]
MKRNLLIAVLILITPLLSNGQTLVTGNVTDKVTQEPLVGAAVVVQGTRRGTITDLDGNFQIRAISGELIVISQLGYVREEIPVESNFNLMVSLAEDVNLLQGFTLVGSRNPNRSELTSPVPIDVIPFSNIQKLSPQIDVSQMLTYAVPSFQSNRQSSSDGSEHIDPAVIRGLGPDQTLVLINGKRRHTTSLLNNQGSLGVGSVGTDLNAIPAAAIERVEVLRDGASAQYGSDAIAGVVNIILKQNTDALDIYAGSGVTSSGDGEYFQVNANYGSALGKKGGYLNFTGDYSFRGTTNRTGNHDLIIFDQSALGNFFAYDFTSNSMASRQYDDDMLAQNGLSRDDFNFRIGDAQTKNLAGFVNLGLPFGNNGQHEFYSFGGVNFRQGLGNGFRRLPSETSNVVTELFPFGFQPNTESEIFDGSLAVGSKFDVGKGWVVDLSNTFGTNSFDYIVTNTNNASMGANSPTRFDAGAHQFTQNTINLDGRKFFKDIAAGFNLAGGAEFRLENYQIRSGEEASYRNYQFVTNPDGSISNPSGIAGGSQSFQGFRPENEVNENRTNVAFYADAELDVVKAWTVAAAARYETYSDFGSALTGKLATMYRFTNSLAGRATISTGFRAPSLHQRYFSYVSTNILPSGQLGQSGIFTNEGVIAQTLGIPSLKEERSRNYSAGVTFNPGNGFSITLDAYKIDVDDRIILTGDFGQDAFGTPVPPIQRLLLPLGAETARILTNGINTETVGLDLVATYSLPAGGGILDFILAGNHNETTIVGDLNISEELIGQEGVFLNPAASMAIERGNPRTKVAFSTTYSASKWSVLFRNTYFGDVVRDGFPFGKIQRLTPKIVTDLSLSYQLTPELAATVGSNNLLNVFPDLQIYENSYFGVFKYAPEQMGMSGAFFFGRLNYRLK